MPPILLHIYGPIAIHSFGAMIVLGLMITLYLLHRDKPLQNLISEQQLTTIFQISFISGIAGGRIWFLMLNSSMMTHWTDYFSVWSGGLSILGAVIAIIGTLSIYFFYTKLPTLRLLDRLALYTPLLQSISRLGCLFAGCCYGKPTHLPWGIMYENYDSLAPLHIKLHPSQMYSSLFLACSFILLLCFDRFYHYKKPGQILALYIMLISLDRFIIDFFRGDREFFIQPNEWLFGNLSIQQTLALWMFLGALIMMIFVTIYKKSDESI
ncbi:MAG: prolipoprotein diacylglyceryl transferase [Candidatus Dependentiae bacterium]|nr:prolipoprotein diacylglyceryl transferase [Candidatus Dependentiae bacterium]